MKQLELYDFLCYPGANKVHNVKQVSDMLLRCAVFVFCVSNKAANNSEIRQQLALAENHDVLMFPVLMESEIALDAAMQYTLARAPSFPFGKKYGNSVKQLVQAIRLGLHIHGRERQAVALQTRITGTQRKTKATEDRVTKFRNILAELEEKKRQQAKQVTVS
eukprot:TRINITY_DN6706_c0_g1_i1.p2 TRINITY_DN6706_c0_g1~~TRINITY_DN6706_c0_g1_i1.p2  ORF type:complete len:163 (-),score=58.38 TRINITY_DN6706_c0_g1_i1:68-556(-)